MECALKTGRLLLDIGELERAADILTPLQSHPDVDVVMRAGEVLSDVYENQRRRWCMERPEGAFGQLHRIGLSRRPAGILAHALHLREQLWSCPFQVWQMQCVP